MYIIKNKHGHILSCHEYAGLCWTDKYEISDDRDATSCRFKTKTSALEIFKDEEFEYLGDTSPYTVVRAPFTWAGVRAFYEKVRLTLSVKCYRLYKRTPWGQQETIRHLEAELSRVDKEMRRAFDGWNAAQREIEGLEEENRQLRILNEQ